MIPGLCLFIFGAFFQEVCAKSPKREFFNEIFKSDPSLFKLQKQPKYSSEDFWICSDGRKILIKDILKGTVSYYMSLIDQMFEILKKNVTHTRENENK